MEFHISRKARDRYGVSETLFSYAGNVVFGNLAASRKLANRVNEVRDAEHHPDLAMHAGALFAMGLIDELSHALVARYRKTLDPQALSEALRWFASRETSQRVASLLAGFTHDFPNVAVYRGELTSEQWLAATTEGMPNCEAAIEEMLLLWLANINPAFTPFREFFEDRDLAQKTIYKNVTALMGDYFATRPLFAPEVGTLLDALRAPMLASPDSLTGQLAYIRDHWVEYLGDELREVLMAIDILKEEDIAIWMRFHPPSDSAWHPEQKQGWGREGFEGNEFVGFSGRRSSGQGSSQPTVHEYEAFSPDQDWMPTVVLIAKSTYVWLEQLSKKYRRHIHRLDQIPPEELTLLAERGLNGLWLIGLWERSNASQTIKRLRGQTDAVASAYSVADYRIADDLGGESAYRYLRDQAAAVGIRLASDMVPNHMGIDSNWVIEHPEWFLSRPESPFPSYRFEGPDLSGDSRIEIKIEDHYYDQTDAAVVFRRRERNTGHTDFVYHGNDGTTFAWNDTAQLDYSKAEVREQVMQTILQVARLFPIIRFDAAMTLAKKHVQRLWFPLPGVGGSIPSRAEDSMTNEEFDALMPKEFWREVVDRVAVEVPGTLLLAEAFWLLEGYFVRTLGMHRVYNSAFMNMLRDEENAKYRSYLKKTIEFDPDILKRYVNFMSNPDERTAIDQFGTEDRYFGVCTLLATLPGLPMFGHGQIEGFTEKYGMEYKQARMDEWPNEDLIARHQREIAPLLKNRQLFAGSSNFFLYDFWTENGTVDENVFAYSNLSYAKQSRPERAIVFFNNRYNSTRGTIHVSAASMDKGSGTLRSQRLADALHLASSDAVIVAYKDAATGLEYLRRSRDIDHHGLAIELRAYQYVVLQDWRELQPTQSHPWDRLCDALNGGGVYNLDEALSKLQLRPLHESLRQLLSPPVIQSVIDLASAGEKQTPDVAELPPSHPAVSAEEADADQESVPEPLLEKARRFYETLEQLAPSVSAISSDHFSQQVATSIRALSTLPKQADCLVQGPVDAPLAGWAAAMAWSILQHVRPDPNANLAIFDQLQLRAALSETFSSLGLAGEDSWRAAARVRVLLEHRTALPPVPLSELLESMQFWNDPDVRWLIGVNEFEGRSFFNQELFERLLLWLLLPELILSQDPEAAQSTSSLESLHIFSAKASAAGYEVEAFLAMLRSPAAAPASEASPARLKDTPAGPQPLAVDAQDQVPPIPGNPKNGLNFPIA